MCRFRREARARERHRHFLSWTAMRLTPTGRLEEADISRARYELARKRCGPPLVSFPLQVEFSDGRRHFAERLLHDRR
jgi:hypothetical protein